MYHNFVSVNCKQNQTVLVVGEVLSQYTLDGRILCVHHQSIWLHAVHLKLAGSHKKDIGCATLAADLRSIHWPLMLLCALTAVRRATWQLGK